MRILIDKQSKGILFEELKKKYNSKNLIELSVKLRINENTLSHWFYDSSRYIPDNFVPLEVRDKIKIIDIQEENWGRVKGGKKTYKIIIKKYGQEEIRKRQSNGGKESLSKNRLIKYSEEKLTFGLDDPIFLEFYGVLLGDGWISNLRYKNKEINIIGISGHYKLDREFFVYLKEKIRLLFNRKAYLKERLKYNSIELSFGHKKLINFLNKKLNFPIGKKINLKIHNEIYNAGFNKMKYVIRGIFDTDGSFYLDRTPAGKPYPCISIKMKAPKLIDQIRDTLLKEEYKVIEYSLGEQKQIKLKGMIQLEKWMRYIGSSNPKHQNKIARVAQPGFRAAHS